MSEHIDQTILMQWFLSTERKLRKAAEDELTRLRSINAELLEACKNFRDAVLWGRYQLEEPCLDNDQTNAVLDLFDDLVGAVITTQSDLPTETTHD